MRNTTSNQIIKITAVSRSRSRGRTKERRPRLYMRQLRSWEIYTRTEREREKWKAEPSVKLRCGVRMGGGSISRWTAHKFWFIRFFRPARALTFFLRAAASSSSARVFPFAAHTHTHTYTLRALLSHCTDSPQQCVKCRQVYTRVCTAL